MPAHFGHFFLLRVCFKIESNLNENKQRFLLRLLLQSMLLALSQNVIAQNEFECVMSVHGSVLLSCILHYSNLISRLQSVCVKLAYFCHPKPYKNTCYRQKSSSITFYTLKLTQIQFGFHSTAFSLEPLSIFL